MSSNVCGNCANFKPEQGAKFFNCTFARQGGVKYAMQVRADTRSCEAFAPLEPPPKPQAPVKPAASTPKQAKPRSWLLCNWGKLVVVAVIFVVILLLAFGAYSCFSGGSPAVTPTPAPPTPTPTPTPTPMPVQYYQVGSWTQFSNRQVYVASPLKENAYYTPWPNPAPAGTSFLVVTVTEFNTGSQAISVSGGYGFYLVSSTGALFLPFDPGVGYGNGAFPLSGFSLPPGQNISGQILFTVPDAATGLEVRTVLDGYIASWKF